MPQPESPDIELADLIVDDINSHFAGQFKAERTWLGSMELKDELDKLRVSINPAFDASGEQFDRTGLTETWGIFFGFAKRIDNNTRQDIDQLVHQVDLVRKRYQLALFENSTTQWQGNGFEMRVRVDPELCQRSRTSDNSIKYGGTFHSLFFIPFTTRTV